MLEDCTEKPTISVDDITASRSDGTVEFTISLDCKPSRAVTVYYVIAREGVIGSTTIIKLTNTEPEHTATVAIGTTEDLGLHVVYATGAANYNAEGTVTFTD